jgi:hypothetical protein
VKAPSAASCLALTCAALALLSWRECGRSTRARAATAAAVQHLQRAQARADALDSSIAASATADSIRRAADDRRVAVTQGTAVRTGAAVAPSLDVVRAAAAALACTDTAGVRQLLARLAEADTAMQVHLAADIDARLAQGDRHTHDSTRIDSLQTVAIPALQRQRAEALEDQRAAIARELALEARAWSTWRKVLTATTCMAAGAGAVTNNAALGIGGGVGCAGSLVLR